MEEKIMSRKEKRQAKKKVRRKQMRKEMARKERFEEEARLNDPEEQKRIQLMEQQEAERMQRDLMEFQERERLWMEQRCSAILLHESVYESVDLDDEDQEEEEEEEPPQIIWRGNEIILEKKKKVVDDRVEEHHQNEEPDADNRPTSNPFPPEPLTQELLAQQVPNFGTEQDKAHCPFHLKTGACRFGQRCSRVHFYPDKSCTLLIKNMYNGPGLAWEQDEGLEYTDEEVERFFEEFYEDVHTEFLKFGEIVNFKVCKNGSFHLRGNVYVQYKLLDSALLAYNSVNGRYFAGKQVNCKFVNLTRWKVAICGEYMKSGFKTCSHGTACNFIHCFRNPGGDYEWADSDKPPPRYWMKKMAALFGYSDGYETLREHGNLSMLKTSSNMSKTDSDRNHSRRSRSRETGHLNSGRSSRIKPGDERKERTPDEENANFKDDHKRKCSSRTYDADSDMERVEKEGDCEKHHEHTRNSSFNRNNGDNSVGSGRRKQEDERKQRTTVEERNADFKDDHHKRKCRGRTPDAYSDREWLEKEDREKHHGYTRNSSLNRNNDDYSDCSGRRKQEDEKKQRNFYKEWNANFKDNHKRKSRGRTADADSDREWLEKEEDRERRHKHRRSSFNRNYNDNGRSHEEDSDVDCTSITRDNEKQLDSEGRHSRKWTGRDWIYEAELDGDRDRKRHHVGKRKSSKHQSSDTGNVTGVSESNEDLSEREQMLTQHDYYRKSLRHRSGNLDYYRVHGDENNEVDGGQYRREGERRAHHHRKKGSKH